MPPARWKSALALSPLALGCAGGVPDPRAAAEAYADAAQRADADALYEMLSQESRREVSLDTFRRLVEENRDELKAHAEPIRGGGEAVRATARIRFDDGEEARLALEDGRFKISQADALPLASASPRDALRQLRKALARRSYPALVRVLSAKTRRAIDDDLRALALGLEDLDSLDLEIEGDRATVRTASGHRIRLLRERGAWQIEAFDR